MKSLYLSFEDEEFSIMLKKKLKLKLTWEQIVKRGLNVDKRRTEKRE